MKTVNLIDIPASALGMGCDRLGGQVSARKSLDALSLAHDNGVSYFDTAPSYGFGASEKIVGRFAKDKRDKIVLTTKFGILPPSNMRLKNLVKPLARYVFNALPGVKKAARKGIQASLKIQTGNFEPEFAKLSIENSLRALSTDYLDFILLHAYTQECVPDELHEVLETLIKQGKVRYYGVCCTNDVVTPLIKNKRDHCRLFQFSSDITDNQIARINRPKDCALITRAPFRKGAIEDKNAALKHALLNNPEGVVLCGMTSHQNIIQNTEIANSMVY